MKIHRSVSVAIVVGNRDELKQLAAAAARYANLLLGKFYLEAQQGYHERLRIEEEQRTKDEDKVSVKVNVTLATLHPYKDFNAELASEVRDAMRTRVETVWKDFAKACLAGHRSLPIFDSDRALSTRNDGVSVRRSEEGFLIGLRLVPGGKKNEHVFPVYTETLNKDLYLAKLLERIAAGELTLTGASVVFSRKHREKILVRLGYKADVEVKAPPRDLAARIGPVGEDGELVLRVDGPAYSFIDRRRLANMTAIVQRMQQMKRDCEKIWNRVRKSKKRNAMRKLRRFEEWAKNPTGQLSNQIVNFLVEKNVARLEWLIEGGDLPWAEVRSQVAYKGMQYGLVVEDPKQEPILKTKGDLECAVQTRKALREAKKASRMGLRA